MNWRVRNPFLVLTTVCCGVIALVSLMVHLYVPVDITNGVGTPEYVNVSKQLSTDGITPELTETLHKAAKSLHAPAIYVAADDRQGDLVERPLPAILAAYPPQLVDDYNVVSALGALRQMGLVSRLRGLSSGIAERVPAPDGKVYAIYVTSAILPPFLINDVARWTALGAGLLTAVGLAVCLQKRAIGPVEP